MYAVVEIAGKQYRVEKDQVISVELLQKKENETFNIDSVLLFENDGNAVVGKPYVQGARVTAQFLGNIKGEKVRGIKFKQRKNYTRTLGHRQNYSQLKITELALS